MQPSSHIQTSDLAEALEASPQSSIAASALAGQIAEYLLALVGDRWSVETIQLALDAFRLQVIKQGDIIGIFKDGQPLNVAELQTLGSPEAGEGLTFIVQRSMNLMDPNVSPVRMFLSTANIAPVIVGTAPREGSGLKHMIAFNFGGQEVHASNGRAEMADGVLIDGHVFRVFRVD